MTFWLPVLAALAGGFLLGWPIGWLLYEHWLGAAFVGALVGVAVCGAIGWKSSNELSS